MEMVPTGVGSPDPMGNMRSGALLVASETRTTGDEMYRLIAELYPICRSITGDGVRETLRRIGEHVPLTVHEVPSGTPVFDWTVPKEWNIVDAYVKNSAGERVIDFRRSNLHVVGYSTPVAARMSLAELRPRLFSLPERPDWIPYRTSYYQDTWGFCLSHNDLLGLRDDTYEVRMESSLTDGFLTYGEHFIAGASTDEILVSCHVCHPALANDNLSGVAVATALAKTIAATPRRYSYRFLFIPGTIGAIAWLARNEGQVSRVRNGLVLANLGDPGGITYKKSRRGNAEIDRAAVNVLRQADVPHTVLDFIPWGYDERQFCSPGFDLPVGCFSRSLHGRFPEYHTSADDLSFVQPASLQDSFERCLAIIDVLEGNGTYVNQNPKCEPQLGKRGLYGGIGGSTEKRLAELAMLWVLNLSDGAHSLLDISDRAGITFPVIRQATDALLRNGLLKESQR